LEAQDFFSLGLTDITTSCEVMRRFVWTLVRYDSAVSNCLPRICLLLTAISCFILCCK